MDLIEVEELLQPVSKEHPCGEDMEYDLSFNELVRSAQGTPERVMGDTVIPAEEADWNEVQRQAVELFSKTKDLRVTIYLIHSLLKTDELPGFAAGMQFLRKLTEVFWQELYPRLDAEDDDDPTFRLNSLMELGDPQALLRDLQHTPLIRSRTMGCFTLRDIRLANGEITPLEIEKEQVPDLAQINAAFIDAGAEQLTQRAAAADQSLQNIKATLSFIDDQLVDANALDLTLLVQTLTSIVRIYQAQLESQGIGTTAPQNDSPTVRSSADNQVSGTAVLSQANAQISPAGLVNCRDDVVAMIDKICGYYQKNEPSSPVPVLLKRAQRLVNMSFMEIMRDLAPDGLSQAENLQGAEPRDD